MCWQNIRTYKLDALCVYCAPIFFYKSLWLYHCCTPVNLKSKWCSALSRFDPDRSRGAQFFSVSLPSPFDLLPFLPGQSRNSRYTLKASPCEPWTNNLRQMPRWGANTSTWHLRSQQNWGSCAIADVCWFLAIIRTRYVSVNKNVWIYERLWSYWGWNLE